MRKKSLAIRYNFKLLPHQGQLLRSTVEEGLFANMTEAVREAIRLLECSLREKRAEKKLGGNN